MPTLHAYGAMRDTRDMSNTLTLEQQTEVNSRIVDRERVLREAVRSFEAYGGHGAAVFVDWLRAKIEEDVALLNGRAPRWKFEFDDVPF